MTLRIGLDYTAAVFQTAGIGRTVREVTRALAANHPADLHLFVASGRDAREINAPPNSTVHRSPLSERTHQRIWHRLKLPVHVEWWTGPVDVYHGADFSLPPTRRRTKTVVTIYDLAFEHFPAETMPGMHAHLTRVVPRSAARADHIITISEATKRDLMEFYGTPEEKISVVPLGVRPRFTPEPDDSDSALRQSLHLPDGPFILAVGTLQPRKNHRRLVRALQHLPDELSLVIAGGSGWAYDAVRQEVERLDLSKRVTFTGFVNDADLPALYRAATVLAYPSLYEGFGLPLLEAMACNVPVVAANTSSLPEVVGEAGILVDPYEPEGIAAGISKALAEAPTLREKGLNQALQFTWVRAAAAHWAIYQQLAEGSSR